MTLKEFGENATIQYVLYVEVNDQTAIKLTAPTEEILLEQLGKVDKAINNKITELYEDLPEPIEDENPFDGGEDEFRTEDR